MASLQDQLLKAGLVDAKKAKKIKKETRKEEKQQPKGSARVNVAREQAKQTMAEQAQRDREINRQRQAAANEKAIRAQIIQLITVNRVDRGQGEVAYQFSDGKKIKKLYVTAALQEELSRGRLAIARLEQRYELVPAAVAEKIRQRDESVIVLQNTRDNSAVDEDDPYADYQIPDDLMW